MLLSNVFFLLLKIVYFTFAHSQIMYGIQFWGVGTGNNLNLLCTLQKICIRKIVNPNAIEHHDPLALTLKFCCLMIYTRFCNLFSV